MEAPRGFTLTHRRPAAQTPGHRRARARHTQCANDGIPNAVRWLDQILPRPQHRRPRHRCTGRRAVLSDSRYRDLYHSAGLCCALKHFRDDIVDVDFHPPRPWRLRVPGELTDSNVDETPYLPLPTNLFPGELRTGLDPHRKVERERLTLARHFRIDW